MAGQLYSIASVDGTHFTDLLATNASEREFLQLPEAIAAGRTCRSILKAAIAWSGTALQTEFAVYGKREGKSPDPNLDEFLGRWEWLAADWQQDEGSGLFRTYIDGLGIVYEDLDRLGRLNLYLINRDANPRPSYGAGGHFRLKLYLEPTLTGG
jgi:hypothetical protein